MEKIEFKSKLLIIVGLLFINTIASGQKIQYCPVNQAYNM